MLLREVSNDLRLDLALLSKFERNARIPSKPQVLSLAKYYQVSSESLLVLRLSDKIVDEVEGEKYALKAVRLVAQRIRGYHKSTN